MRFLNSLFLGALLIFAAGIFSHPAQAAIKSAPAAAAISVPAAPKAEDNPALATILKSGAKLYYIGSRAGLDGWFIFKDGRMQLAYTTSDKQTVIVGAMFGADGTGISSEQMKVFLEAHPDIATQLGTAMQQNLATAATTAPLPQSTPAVSPGDKLVQDLSAASGVTVGGGGAQLFMVMDPDCPHCQATWRMLRDQVFKNQIQIRMIPIAAPGSDSERAAAVLLAAADPLNAWDKYVGPDKNHGDKTQLAGTADPVLVKAVQTNHAVIDSWSIDQTPYLVYRGKDGKIKIIEGEPAKLSAFLSDLIP